LAGDAQRVDVRLERTPAGKAITLREIELRVRQLSFGIYLSKLLKPPLCLLAKPVEVRGVGQRGRRLGVRVLLSHVSPSFSVKGRALSYRPLSANGAGKEGCFRESFGV